MNFFKKLTKKESKDLTECLAEMGTAFTSKEEAESFFFKKRDAELSALKNIESIFPELSLDNSGESLQRLEDFYFDNYIDGKNRTNVSKEEFEKYITQYTRQVFVENKISNWIVFENEFSPGQFEIGLDYGNGEGTNQNFGEGLEKKENSELRRYLFQTFQMYLP